MARRVAITSLLEKYTGDADEVWGVNCAYQIQDRLDRIYFFDRPDLICPSFVEDVRMLDVDVFAVRHYNEIPRSKPYPVDDVVAEFGGVSFVCTVAWMIAHAIYEKVDSIDIAGMYSLRNSHDYLSHKANLDFWLGVALGRGIHLKMCGDTGLLKPYAWQPGRYGFIRQKNEVPSMQVLAAAHRAIDIMPIQFYDPHTLDEDELVILRKTAKTAMLRTILEEAQVSLGCENESTDTDNDRSEIGKSEVPWKTHVSNSRSSANGKSDTGGVKLESVGRKSSCVEHE